VKALILGHRSAGASPGPGEPGRITVADMDELVAAGQARALLPEFDVGPTW
jgi:hypothetical protein